MIITIIQKDHKKLTHEIMEEVVIDEPGSFGTAMAIVDSDKDGIGTGLDLAVILNDLIGLNHRERELAARVLLEVPAPQ